MHARLAVQLDLVALHRLLDGGADFAEARVDARLANARLRCGFGSLDEVLVAVGVQGEGECAVDDAAVDLPKVSRMCSAGAAGV